MKAFALILASFVSIHAFSAPAAPKYNAALMKETDAFLKAIDNVLKPRDDGYDLKRKADHSRWGMDLKKRADVFIGGGSDRDKFSSPYSPCRQAVYWATEIWSSRMSYDQRPTKFNYDSVERWAKEYQTELRGCASAAKTKN